MLKKRKWIIISIIAAVIVVVMGILGSIAYADSNTDTGAAKTQTDPQKVLADKVANILGVDPAKVEAAFTQAQKEINAERSAEMLKAEEARIDKMVTDGKLTADQAAKYKTWLESKPNVNIPGMGMNRGFDRGGSGHGFPGGFGRGMFPGGNAPSTTSPTN
jgi:hypothetical protein